MKTKVCLNYFVNGCRYDQDMTSNKSTDLAKIHNELSVLDKSMSSDMDATPPNLCSNSAEVSNNSNSVTSQKTFIDLSSQDDELFSILDDLQHKEMSENIIISNRIQEYFCADTVVNLSKKVINETEIKVLEKGLDFT